MKKWFLLCGCLLLVLLCAAAAADVDLSAENFPDEQFLEIVRAYDKNGDGVLSSQEISLVKEIDCSCLGIGNLQGVEFLTSLQSLNCKENCLTALNVKSNTKLTYLDCTTNSLKQLDVSRNTALATLWCTENGLTALNLGKNKALKQLGCASNQLKTLSLNANTRLTELYCNDNGITKFDLSSCPALVRTVQKSERINSGEGYDYWSYEGSMIYADSGVTVTAGSTVSKPTDAAEIATVKGGVYIIAKNEAVLKEAAKNSLTSLTVQDYVTGSKGRKVKVTSIAPNACANMPKLKKVKIGANVKTIGNCAFINCGKLKTVSGGKAVTSIGDSAFDSCKSLTAFVINEKVKKIGKAAFRDCAKLKKITVLTTRLKASSVGANAFANTAKKAVVICPAKKLKAYKKLFVQKGLSKKATFK